MEITSLEGRAKRGNQMLQALEKETPRGQACVGDALLDELVKEIFTKRLTPTKESEELLPFSQPLGSHGARLKVAYALGWIGPLTYKYAKLVHKVRNAMAHDLDAEAFEHQEVRTLIDKISTQEITPPEMAKATFPLPHNRLGLAVMFCMMQFWGLLDDSQQPSIGEDRPMVSLPQPD